MECRLTASKVLHRSSMTTIFVCDDQKAKYTEGACAKPDEQRRALFSLWFAYAVDVVSDLAGMCCDSTQGIIAKLCIYVPPVLHDVESSTTQNTKTWYLHHFWQWLGVQLVRYTPYRSGRRQGWCAVRPGSKLAANVDYHRVCARFRCPSPPFRDPICAKVNSQHRDEKHRKRFKECEKQCYRSNERKERRVLDC
jgi:hypothetical protein